MLTQDFQHKAARVAPKLVRSNACSGALNTITSPRSGLLPSIIVFWKK